MKMISKFKGLHLNKKGVWAIDQAHEVGLELNQQISQQKLYNRSNNQNERQPSTPRKESCCNCALSLLLSVVFFVIIALAIIAVACYFGLYKVEKDSELDHIFNTINNLTGKAKDQVTN